MVGTCLSLELEVSPKGCNREIYSEQAGKHKEKGNPVPYPGNGRMVCMANMPWQSTKHLKAATSRAHSKLCRRLTLCPAWQRLQEVSIGVQRKGYPWVYSHYMNELSSLGVSMLPSKMRPKRFICDFYFQI